MKLAIQATEPRLVFRDLVLASVSASVVTALIFALTWRYGMDLGDEAYYWYGAQRVVAGEVPIRDFMAYDPGRYYWAALVMRSLGSDGIFAARLAAALFQALGVLAGTYAVLVAARTKPVDRRVLSVGTALLLTLWIWPYYKSFDHAASIFVAVALFHAIRFKSMKDWLAVGVALGLCAVIGRNHGVYGVAALTLLVVIELYTNRQYATTLKLLTTLVAGIIIGYAPVLIAMVAVDGFAAAFLDSILALFVVGATNIALPVPWPWRADIRSLGVAYFISEAVSGLFFIALIALPLAIWLNTLRPKNRSADACWKLLLACSATALPYSHYAFARADTVHLALAVFPVMIALIAFAVQVNSRTVRNGLVFSLVLASIAAIGIPRFYNKHYVSGVDLLIGEGAASERVVVSSDFAESVGRLISLINSNASTPTSFLALPNLLGLHAIQRAPIGIWEIYALIPRTTSFDAQEIERIKLNRPSIILVSNHPLDGRSEFRYSTLHPHLYQWIATHCTLISRESGSDLEVYECDQYGA